VKVRGEAEKAEEAGEDFCSKLIKTSIKFS
jgi:hypothetical protein